MPLKTRLPCLVFGACLALLPGHAATAPGSETCTIDGNQVLLYKIINFWYDCLPEETGQICGTRLHCQSRGEARVGYTPGEKLLEIRVETGFMRLLAVAGKPGAGAGPGTLNCVMLNRAYFGRGTPAALSESPEETLTFRFYDLDRAHYRKLKRIEKDIAVEVEGPVSGLLDGRIALVKRDGLLKHCPGLALPGGASPSVSVRLVIAKTREVLAVYAVAPGN